MPRVLIAILSSGNRSIELDRRPDDTAPRCIDDWLALGDIQHALLDTLGLSPESRRSHWATLVSWSRDSAEWELHGHKIELRIVNAK